MRGAIRLLNVKTRINLQVNDSPIHWVHGLASISALCKKFLHSKDRYIFQKLACALAARMFCWMGSLWTVGCLKRCWHIGTE